MLPKNSTCKLYEFSWKTEYENAENEKAMTK